MFFFSAPPSASIIPPALRPVGNLLTGDDLQTEAVLQSGFMSKVAKLLANKRRSIQKEVIWAISNITAGTVSQIETVIRAELIPKLVAIAHFNSNVDIIKEVIWALSNFLSGGSQAQILYVMAQGLVGAFVQILSQIVPANTKQAALEGLTAMLKKVPQLGPQLNPLLDLLLEWESSEYTELAAAASGLLGLIDDQDQDS